MFTLRLIPCSLVDLLAARDGRNVVRVEIEVTASLTTR